jgi:hypothetical protein
MKIVRWVSLVLLIILFVLIGYWALNPANAPGWTGFGPYDQAIQGPRSKTLWDWVEILLIPIVLALGAWLLSAADKEADRKIETDRQRQEILTSLFQKISELLVTKNLRASKASREVRSIARSYALSTFRLLDPDRKAEAIQFLVEARLIDSDPIINLNGANLRGIRLNNAYLSGIEIKGAHLENAYLQDANIENTNFCGSNLTKANLKGATIRHSDFSFTILNNADLRGCDLTSVNLQGAILLGAKLKGVVFSPNQINIVILDKKYLSTTRK